MHPPFEAFYIEAMRWHTNSAAKSMKTVQAIAYLFHDDGEILPGYESKFLDALNNIIHQAGCLSRYFFPSRNSKLHAERAMKLRGYLNVPEGSPLSDRNLRDAMEHFDERLDKYLEHGLVGHVLPKIVIASYDEPEVPVHIFQGFVMDEGKFCLLNEWFDIGPIMAELSRIGNELDMLAGQGHVFKRQ